MVNGPEDEIVSEMIRSLPMENLHYCQMFSRTLHGPYGIPKLVEGCETLFLKKPDTAPTKGIRSYRAIALTSVMSKWYASCVLLRLEKETDPVKLRSLHMGDVTG